MSAVLASDLVSSYKELQSLRLVALKFGMKKQTVHSAIRRAGCASILRRPYISYSWERSERRAAHKVGCRCCSCSYINKPRDHERMMTKCGFL
jgi:hypothetical protein